MAGCQFVGPTFTPAGCPNATLLMSLLATLVSSDPDISQPCRRATLGDKVPKVYDFIVVGAGVAGSVVASRLSEEGKWNVLLLEAGPEEPTLSSVPSMFFSPMGSHLDWGFRTEPQPTACLQNGGVCSWPRGRMVGGSGSMSGMMYTRGNREIFNEWARNGNPGWTYWECLQYFKKAERNLNEDVEKEYHGRDGPLLVQRFPDRPAMTESLLKGMEELGYREGDLNGANQTGVTVAQMMIDNAVRSNTPRAYLRPAMRRKNLFVVVNATVTKVLIRRMRAVGVQFHKDGRLTTVSARKEVVLSAGAVGSPHLLLLSGVGPRRDLEGHHIPLVKELPVGRNLHNHVAVAVRFSTNTTTQALLTYGSVDLYMAPRRSGPLASTGLTQVTAFLHSRRQPLPDLQFFFDGFLADCSSVSPRPNIFTVRPTNILPKSKGFLTLKTANPFDSPKIYPNYLSDRADVDVLIDGIKTAIRLSQSPALRHWNMSLLHDAPLCDHLPRLSDPYWECVVRTYTGAENHQGGSCKMGPVKDPTAVVDPELRVHGIVNLRVIDASIFPYVPNANPISSIVMVAEKGSFMIQSAWRTSKTT